MSEIKCINTLRELSNSAPKIKNIYPNVTSITISAVAICECSEWSKPKVERYNKVLYPEDRMFLYYECPNKECSGSCFNLTYDLQNAVRQAKEILNTEYCNGKEGEHSEYECPSHIEYTIVPDFR